MPWYTDWQIARVTCNAISIAHPVWDTEIHCILFYRKLLLHLPYHVDSKNGKARFLSEEETLEVTLRVSRKFDFIDFVWWIEK